ncbi:T9SS type A sorting domain-containing protein [Brumimicrobium mesophilum]|uniref:T9SS type A sorting domain-containing protein n=1 Tax=Brumimicrobium mesophilum TaxID=392717 RepID=UPI000D140E2D|nr:T9SS type A sorting domain-containing protein [Brumimicrobium mesophilum]
MNKIILLASFLVSLSSVGQELEHYWSGSIGDPVPNTSQIPVEVVIDADNNKYISGRFTGTHDFDPGPGVFQLNSMGSDIYILKLDSMNNFLWANSYGTTGSLENTGLVVDPSGSAYTYGYFKGNLFCDPQNSITTCVSSTWWYEDCYVHKLKPNGDFDWIKAWGNSGRDGISHMVMDEQQNFYFTGTFESNFDADEGPGVYTLNSPPGNGTFLAKYDANFNFIWAKQYEGTGSSIIHDFNLNDHGELTLTGGYTKQIDFDMSAGEDLDTSQTTGYTDLFTHVMDTSGVSKWHHTIKGSNSQRNFQIVEDSERNRYVHGTFLGTIDFNPGGTPNVIEALGFSDAYLIKLDSLGNQIWAKVMHGEGSDRIHGMTIDDDQLLVFATIEDKTDVNLNSGIHIIEPPLQMNDLLYIEKLDGNANILWHEEFIGSNILGIRQLVIDEADNYFVVGHLYGTVDLDPSAGVAQLSHSNNITTFFASFGELPCAPLGTDLSSHTNATCSASGGVDAIGVSGVPPYSFSWLTNPPISGAQLVTDTTGMYLVEVTDASGCVDTNGVYIEGATTSAGFDLDVNMVSGNFIQGQPNILWLDAYNGGCQSVSGSIQLILDPLVQYDSASVAPSSIQGDTLIWNYSNWNYDSTHFMAAVFVTTSQSAITGDTVCFKAIANPMAGDVDTLNNLKSYCELVLASYDPNDKKVYPAGTCDDHVYMEQPLTYTVRFQNTGNSEAIHVNIIDTLDSNLDLSTFEVLGQSHPMLEINYSSGQIVQFNFENIYLPDSLSDPLGSNGYVVFKIEPHEGMAINTEIGNEVNIYFDFNSPILTNTATTTFTDDIPCDPTDNVSVYEHEDLIFSAYPNPMNSEVIFKINNKKSHNLVVYSSEGVAVMTSEIVDGSILSIVDLSVGVYYFIVDESHVMKMVKH